MEPARPIAAALALLAILAGSAAVARHYLNSGGDTVSQGVVIESGDVAVSAANPLPVAAVATAAPGIAPASTTAATLIAKAGGGNLYGYNATAGATAAFVAVLNAASVPAVGAAIAPLECSAVPANGTFRVRQDIPDRYSVGIVLLFTSSCSTHTAVTPAVLTAVVQ